MSEPGLPADARRRSPTSRQAASRLAARSRARDSRGGARRHPRTERLGQDDAASRCLAGLAAPWSGPRAARRHRPADASAARDRRTADGDRSPGNAARLRVHGARDGHDGPLSAPRRVRDRRPRRSRDRARRAARHRHAAPGIAAASTRCLAAKNSASSSRARAARRQADPRPCPAARRADGVTRSRLSARDSIDSRRG